MEDAKNFLRQACDALSQPLFILGADRRCVYANSAFHSFLGREPGDAGDLVTESFWPAVRHCDLACEDVSTELVVREGESCRVRLGITSLSSGYSLVCVTASAFVAASAGAFHGQRLETLGMLASGVAHDFNNVLAGILGHVTYLKNILPPSGPHVESLRSIEEGAHKSSVLTQQILAFSRMESTEKVVRIDLCDLMLRTCRLLQGAISRVYSLKWKIPDEELCILGVEGRIAQVLVNLVINSRDALSPGGAIDVALGATSSPDVLQRVFRGQDLSARSFAVISVTDNGHGIPVDVLPRMFEPYFSTKKEKGTGLGLSTVDAIVRLYGGAINVHSVVGNGTTIDVYFPLLEAARAQIPAGPQENKEVLLRAAAAERILIVDDEDPVRNVLSISLRHLGYQIEVASSGEEAIRKYSSDEAGFDLVILDVLMPQVSGDEVFFRLRSMDPEARVLLMSGFSSPEVIKKVLENGGRGFMQKPFTIEELSRRVRECLA